MTEERLKRFFTREGDRYRVDARIARHRAVLQAQPAQGSAVFARGSHLLPERADLPRPGAAARRSAPRSTSPCSRPAISSSAPPKAPTIRSGCFAPSTAKRESYQRMPLPAEARVTPRSGRGRLVSSLCRSARRPVSPAKRSGNPSGGPGTPRAAERRSSTSPIGWCTCPSRPAAICEPSGGTLANDITELAREELRFDIRAALHRVFARNEASLSGPIGVRFNGAVRRVYLQARPIAPIRTPAAPPSSSFSKARRSATPADFREHRGTGARRANSAASAGIAVHPIAAQGLARRI